MTMVSHIVMQALLQNHLYIYTFVHVSDKLKSR